MSKATKTTWGFVEQVFEDGKCISQNFVAGDQVEWDDEMGLPLGDVPDHEYFPYNMVQPYDSPEDELNDLLTWAREQGLDSEDLDDTTHEIADLDASGVNNEGMRSQLNLLMEKMGGAEEVKTLLRELFCIS